jgi:hypothetical protein
LERILENLVIPIVMGFKYFTGRYFMNHEILEAFLGLERKHLSL